MKAGVSRASPKVSGRALEMSMEGEKPMGPPVRGKSKRCAAALALKSCSSMSLIMVMVDGVKMLLKKVGRLYGRKVV